MVRLAVPALLGLLGLTHTATVPPAIVHMVQIAQGTRTDLWVDIANGRARSVVKALRGRVEKEYASSTSGRTIRIDIVDPVERTWTTEFLVYGRNHGMPTGASVAAGPTPGGIAAIGDTNRSRLTAGPPFVRRGLVSGVPALDYQAVDVPNAGGGLMTIDAWYEESSYLELRETASWGSTPASVVTWDWHVPAAQGLRQLRFVHPRGYRHTTSRRTV